MNGRWLRGERPHFWLSLCPVLICFILSIWQMRYDWTYDETYHYGWAVPLLMAYLLSVRWRDRPAPAPSAVEHRKVTGWAVIALLLPVVWLVREANPEWRLVSIALAALAIASALLWLREIGGNAWMRHFGGAVAFFAVGVPWPTLLEKSASAVLMPANASMALEALHWLGIPSIRRGNLITLVEGTLGVEEACSGIRSLQATLMMAVFLGELNLLRWPHRLALVVAGLLTALLTNALRTIGLSAVAARSGLESARGWHDSAGLIVLVINAAMLLLLSYQMAKAGGRHVRKHGPAGSSLFPSKQQFSRGPMLCLAALVLMGPLVAVWYGRHENAAHPLWQLLRPVTAPNFREVPVDYRTRQILRFSDGWSARWSSPSGNEFQGYYFVWKPGKTPPGNMNLHRPGSCLANVGIELLEEAAPLQFSSPGHILPVRFLHFRDGKRPLYVAYFVSEDWEVGPDADVGAFDASYSRRMAAVLAGRRNSGQRLLEVGLWDEPSEATARESFTQFLSSQLQWNASGKQQ